MTGPFDRVPGIDHDAQLPLPVRERMAQNFSDPSTPEGAELSRMFVQFRNFDGSAVAAGSVVVVTLTEDGTDIHDITVEEA